MPALCVSVGHVVVNWGLFESSLNQCTAVIYQGAREHHVEKQLPWGYTRKKRFLRHCFNNIEILKPLKEEGIAILDKSVPIGRIRDHVVHGQLSDYQPETQTIIFAVMDRDPKADINTLEFVRYTFRQLLDCGSECQNLSLESAKLAQHIAKMFMPENPADEPAKPGAQ